MKFYIKQKMFSLRQNFYVTDENGTDVFQVKGELMSLRGIKHVLDMEGNELATISRELMKLFPTFNVEIGGEHAFTLRQRFSWFKTNLDVDGLGWTIQGNYFDHEYQIDDGSKAIGFISKKYFALSDSFEIEVLNPENVLYVITMVLAVDAILDAKQRR